MLSQWKGCLLGAAIGDALGMAGESNPPRYGSATLEYRRAYKSHPNGNLAPGQYTDDTQILLLVARLLADGVYTEARHAELLRDMHASGSLRFPDASVAVACDRMLHRGLRGSGVNSNTAGCICVAIPFALACSDLIEVRERVVKACSLTHIHPAAYAASVAVALLLYHTLRGAPDAVALAGKGAALEDPHLAGKCQAAVQLGEEGISLDAALGRIGNDVSVFHTLPLALYLISRYRDPLEILARAASVGGNTDTIGLICGAYVGARHGTEIFPADLLADLENRAEIETLAERLHALSIQKH